MGSTPSRHAPSQVAPPSSSGRRSMTNEPITISLLAGLESTTSGAGLNPKEREELVASLRKTAHELSQLQRYDLGERLAGFLTESLRKPGADVLAEVWKQRKEMQDAAAKGKDGRVLHLL